MSDLFAKKSSENELGGVLTCDMTSDTTNSSFRQMVYPQTPFAHLPRDVANVS